MNPGLPGMPTKGFVVLIAAIAERQTLNSFVGLVASAGPLALSQIPPVHPGMTAGEHGLRHIDAVDRTVF